jgi:hypothetical protein
MVLLKVCDNFLYSNESRMLVYIPHTYYAIKSMNLTECVLCKPNFIKTQ